MSKRKITDKQRLDFLEAKSKEYEDLYGNGRETGWSAVIYSPPLRSAKGETFRYDTIRKAIDASMRGAQ